MQGIGTGLGRHIDLNRAAAELGGVDACLDFELL
jgi:hypothetical protein